MLLEQQKCDKGHFIERKDFVCRSIPLHSKTLVKAVVYPAADKTDK